MVTPSGMDEAGGETRTAGVVVEGDDADGVPAALSGAGVRPVEGDVACFADADAPAELYAPDPDRLQRVTADRVDIVSRHCERGRAFVTAPLVGTGTDLAGGEPGHP